MRVYRTAAAAPAHPRVVALGTFDGVHVGHQAVIGRAVARAREEGLASAVVTFDRHPLSVVDPGRTPRLLTPLEEKLGLIATLGPDEAVVLPFDAALASLPAEAFCRDLLHSRLRARAVVVGENFRFGAGGAGDPEALRRWGEELGLAVEVVPLVNHGGQPISSSRIRRLLARGALEEVRAILGRPPAAEGVVVGGDRRGRRLGVPTANVDVEAHRVFPGRGVYLAAARVGADWFRAAVNVGRAPTFRAADDEAAHLLVEAHLLGFSGDLYGRRLRLEFLHKLRDEQRFDDVDGLLAQLRRDLRAAAALDDPVLREHGLPPRGDAGEG